MSPIPSRPKGQPEVTRSEFERINGRLDAQDIALSALKAAFADFMAFKATMTKTAISILTVVIMQAATGVWWAATLSTDVQHLSRVSVDLSSSVREIDRTRFPANEEENYRSSVQRVLEKIQDRLMALEKAK